MKLSFQQDDGGRAAAGYRGYVRDCVCRSIAIASQRPYQEVYDTLAVGNATQRRGKHYRYRRQPKSAAYGIDVKRKWFKEYMSKLGFVWVPTMLIGSGCKVHLHDDELPEGRLVVVVSGHYTSVIDGVIHDTWDPRREVHCVDPDKGQELRTGQCRNPNGICSIQRRCVYGYWRLAQ